MRLSRKLIKILGFSLLGIMILGGFFAVGKPLIDQTKTQASELTDTQTKNDGLQSTLGNLQSVKTNVAEVDKINSQLLKQFPELANVPDLLNTIGNAASSAGISPEDITQVKFSAPTIAAAPEAAAGTTSTTEPSASASASASPSPSATAAAGSSSDTTAGTSAPTSKLASMSVDITASGTPRQFQNFLSGLSEMDRAFTVSTFNIAVGDATDGSTGGTLTLSGTTFVYSHIATPEETQATTGSTSNNTTTTPSGSATTPSN